MEVFVFVVLIVWWVILFVVQGSVFDMVGVWIVLVMVQVMIVFCFVMLGFFFVQVVDVVVDGEQFQFLVVVNKVLYVGGCFQYDNDGNDVECDEIDCVEIGQCFVQCEIDECVDDWFFDGVDIVDDDDEDDKGCLVV